MPNRNVKDTLNRIHQTPCMDEYASHYTHHRKSGTCRSIKHDLRTENGLPESVFALIGDRSRLVRKSYQMRTAPNGYL